MCLSVCVRVCFMCVPGACRDWKMLSNPLIVVSFHVSAGHGILVLWETVKYTRLPSHFHPLKICFIENFEDLYMVVHH